MKFFPQTIWMSVALLLVGCSKGSNMLKTEQTGWITPLAAISEVTKMATQEYPEAVLVGVLSSDQWSSGLRLGTSDQIDGSYIDPIGKAPMWDFYFAKNAQAFQKTENGYEISRNQLFGFRYIYLEKKKESGYVKLPSEAFTEKIELEGNASVNNAKLDSDVILKKVNEEIGTRFLSLKYDRTGERFPREIYYLSYALQPGANGSTWELSMVFPDDFDGKYGAVMSFDAVNGSPLEEPVPFYVKKETKSERVSRRKMQTYEVLTRDFSKAQELLALWKQAAANAQLTASPAPSTGDSTTNEQDSEVEKSD